MDDDVLHCVACDSLWTGGRLGVRADIEVLLRSDLESRFLFGVSECCVPPTQDSECTRGLGREDTRRDILVGG